MNKLLLLPLAVFMCSCASTTPVATFQATSLAPVEQAVTRVEQHVSGAQSAAKKLEAATDAASKQDKAWQAAYNELTNELNTAYLSTQNAKDEVKAKQAEINDVTDYANKVTESLAKERDTQKAKADAEYHAKMAWMKRFWYAAGAALLLSAWVFRGLWMPLLAAI